MLDHVGIPVSDYARSKGFYLRALAPLGYDLVLEVSSKETGGDSHAGFGAKGRPQFWIGSGKPVKGRVHFAFEAKSREAVRAFYDAALQAGGKDNGAPGLRPHYHANYYGAFVLDPDGHNIEAVCHLAA
ncbi:MAG: VOC family protein [Hyphomicrobiaceae bacterium]|nr:MAG: VOC family protein [Hyphomicrobiaceae bacterium]